METVMPVRLAQVSNAFDTFRQLAGFGPITTEDEYDRAMTLVGDILDATRGTPQREDPAHPLSRLLDWITPAIRAYEVEHVPMPDVEPREVLRFLMAQHGLSQSIDRGGRACMIEPALGFDVRVRCMSLANATTPPSAAVHVPDIRATAFPECARRCAGIPAPSDLRYRALRLCSALRA